MKWIRNTGRNQEGDRFDLLDLVDESTGRILATVDIPIGDSHDHTCQIHLRLTNAFHHYTSLDAAKKYCEDSIHSGLRQEAVSEKRADQWLRRQEAPRWKRILHLV